MAPNMKRWSDAKLEKEIAFAVAAEDRNCPDNMAWLTKLKLEALRRQVAGLQLGDFAARFANSNIAMTAQPENTNTNPS